jgi:formate hydrogenlyase transcriptional activator
VAYPWDTNTQRYDAVLRISEGLSSCCEPEALAKTLADQLAEFLQFDSLDVLVLKENSKEVERHAWGKGSMRSSTLPAEELPAWHVINTQEVLHINDWNNDQRFPRLKQIFEKLGINVGSAVRLPLTTPHRRLGTLGITSRFAANYSAEDIGFLQLLARLVAFAIDDSLNLSRTRSVQAELQRQNERLQLLLNLTNRITSNLKLRELLRAVAANVREVMESDLVSVTISDLAAGKNRLYALDFPQGKGFIREEEIFSITGALKRALETLKPAIANSLDPSDIAPEMYDKVTAEGLRRGCFIPLVHRDRALGVLGIGRLTDVSFTPEDIEFLTQAAGQIAIAVENALAYKEISELKDKLAQEKLYLEEEIRSEMNFEQIVGNSSVLKHVLELVNTVAPSDSTVLLLGETGTGKELIARAIHDRSRRKDRTLVKMNCAAIPTGLLESELFGHEKGAFTGAISQKAGRLELADQSTLFLDEVGDIPTEIQPKLLRALQEREFERLGSTHTRSVNIRLIAATNRDLEKMIAEGNSVVIFITA